MTKRIFRVEERQAPGRHQPKWVAVDETNGAEIDLPEGGDRALLGRYPEIAEYLSSQGIVARLGYSRALGDTLDIDYRNGRFTWTFSAAGVVVEDIPRLACSVTIDA